MQVTNHIELAFAKLMPKDIRAVLEQTGLISCTEKRNYCLCILIEKRIESGNSFTAAIGIVLSELKLDISHRQVRNIFDEGRKRYRKLADAKAS